MELPVLETPRLRLRFAEAADADQLVDFFTRNRAFFERTNPARPADVYRREHWSAHAERMKADYREDRAMSLFAFLRADAGRLVGSVNLFHIVRGSFHAATLGYSLDEQHTRQGLMSEAVEAVVAHGFQALRLHRIMANYWVENLASGRLLARCGFEREGYARDYLLIGGRWVDHYNTARTHAAWQPPP
jgi:ribosomal-protein-alanine N-acetyltransferase